MPDRWMETATDAVILRHDGRDARDAQRLAPGLAELATACAERLGLGPIDPHRPPIVVLHATRRQLLVAHPTLSAVVGVTSRRHRRLIVGAAAGPTAHVLSPRALRDRAVGGGPEEREFARLAPHAALVQALVSSAAPQFKRPSALVGRAAWVLWGAGQYFSGQTDHTNGLIRRHLRRAERASFPPGRADAVLLGGSVMDLISRQRGEGALVDLISNPSKDAVARALGGVSDAHAAGPWRAHLARVAEGAER